jgi:hypothetical protein
MSKLWSYSALKISIFWKALMLPVFYYLSNLTYAWVFNMFGIGMAVPDRVESFLLTCAVALTALMVWGAFLEALSQAKEPSSY